MTSHARAIVGAFLMFTSGCVLCTSGSALAASAARCSDTPPRKTVAYERIRGVARDLTSLDVYAPPRRCVAGGGRAPVVMWVHGGGYAIGDKRNKVRDKVALFARRGYIFIGVNYRLSRAGNPASAKYPDHFRDVAAAVAWTRSHIFRWGGDRTRVALLGHSAGADIVANVTANPRWLGEHNLKLGAVRCAGPLDTAGFDKLSPGGSAAEKAQWQNALGNDPNYQRDTSATYLVKRGIGIPPTITVVRGTARRQAIEQHFADTLRAAGVATTIIDARVLTHEQVSERIGAPGDTVMTPPLTRFLNGCFRR
jgi:arylformamidase